MRQGAIRKRSNDHARASPRSSNTSDIYARNSDLLLEKHLSLRTISRTSTFDQQMPLSPEELPTSQDVLKDINKDLDKIRRNIKRALSSSTSSDRDRSSISSGSNDKLNKFDILSPNVENGETICSEQSDDDSSKPKEGERPSKEEVQDVVGPLPSRSVCVDSGLVMDDEFFCTSDTKERNDLKPLEDVNAEASPTNVEAKIAPILPANINRDSGCDDLSLQFGSSCSLDETQSELSPPVNEISRNQDQTTAKNDLIYQPRNVVETEDFVTTKNKEFADEIFLGETASDTIDLPDVVSPPEKVSEDAQIEPLLRSSNVGLKTKLRALSELYSSDDREKLEYAQKVFDPPYNVFNKNR